MVPDFEELKQVALEYIEHASSFAQIEKMQTGVFEASYEENGNWVYKTLFADASGAINMSSGWKAKNDDWYYVKADGTMAVSEWVDQNKYYVDANGKWVKNKTK